MNDLILNIYDDSGKTVVKTFKASTCDLMFRTVRKLMDLLKIENRFNELRSERGDGLPSGAGKDPAPI